MSTMTELETRQFEEIIQNRTRSRTLNDRTYSPFAPRSVAALQLKPLNLTLTAAATPAAAPLTSTRELKSSPRGRKYSNDSNSGRGSYFFDYLNSIRNSIYGEQEGEKSTAKSFEFTDDDIKKYDEISSKKSVDKHFKSLCEMSMRNKRRRTIMTDLDNKRLSLKEPFPETELGGSLLNQSSRKSSAASIVAPRKSSATTMNTMIVPFSNAGIPLSTSYTTCSSASATPTAQQKTPTFSLSSGSATFDFLQTNISRGRSASVSSIVFNRKNVKKVYVITPEQNTINDLPRIPTIDLEIEVEYQPESTKGYAMSTSMKFFSAPSSMFNLSVFAFAPETSDDF